MPGKYVRARVCMDFSSLYPNVWANEKFKKELQRIKLIKERKEKLENLNKMGKLENGEKRAKVLFYDNCECDSCDQIKK